MQWRPRVAHEASATYYLALYRKFANPRSSPVTYYYYF